MYVSFSSLHIDVLVTPKYQLAKGDISNVDIDTLGDWLESVENFIGRISVYTDQTLQSAMVEKVTRIMEELISTLALVTEKLKGRRQGGLVLAEM